MSARERSIDWLVLTAANRAQARGYESQLDTRERDGRLAGVRNWIVVPDPSDRRIGSGGSTFTVLRELARRSRGGNAFENLGVVIIHSGGDSRRLPAYAAEGKVFVPLPRTLDTGQPATLFDLILADLSPLVRPGRVLIGTGDVLLGVGKHNPDLSARGMVGVAFRGPASTGARHGVYVCDGNGRITDFLQKPTRAQARERRALDRNGRLLIDTGILSLDAPAARHWANASASLVRQFRAGTGPSIDLYSELLPALYARGSNAGRLERFRIPFRAEVVPPCEFLHIGSTVELLSISTRQQSTGHQAVRLNSVVSAPLLQHSTSFVESSRITRRTRLGNHSMLVGFPGGAPVHLRDHLGMVFLPIGRGDWTCIAFGVKDDFKTPFGRGGTFCNKLVRDRTLAEVSAWDLPVWAIGSVRSVLHHALAQSRALRPHADHQLWSMAQLMPRVNIDRVLEHRRVLQAEDAADLSASILRKGGVPPAHLVLSAPRSRHAGLTRLIASRLRPKVGSFSRARLHRIAALLDFRHAASHDALAFASVAEGVARSTVIPSAGARAALTFGRSIRVTCPVRIDLCGGWSDTPPICHEQGGTVVNAAITLAGRQPVCVEARLIEEPVIRLCSIDQSRSLTISDAVAARSHHDPHDWAALPKAALLLAGITHRHGNLARRLRAFGGGLELTMSVAVPKGSGLGTSSILGAAVLACLDRVCGRKASVRSLIERTSVLEQMMSTAGGWQDQAGGITPGFKMLRSRAGADQTPRIQRLKPPARAMRDLNERSLLYYTGQRRLAKDILRGVVRRYLSGEPAALRIIGDLKAAAEAMAKDLLRGDIDAFARGVLRNWELKKAIDPGSTNRRIEGILRTIEPRLTGYELAGAGGGGFIFMIARSARDAKEVRRTLRRARSRGAALVEFAWDEEGLKVDEIATAAGP